MSCKMIIWTIAERRCKPANSVGTEMRVTSAVFLNTKDKLFILYSQTIPLSGLFVRFAGYKGGNTLIKKSGKKHELRFSIENKNLLGWYCSVSRSRTEAILLAYRQNHLLQALQQLYCQKFTFEGYRFSRSAWDIELPSPSAKNYL